MSSWRQHSSQHNEIVLHLVFYRRVKALVDMELVRDGEAKSDISFGLEHDFRMDSK